MIMKKRESEKELFDLVRESFEREKEKRERKQKLKKEIEKKVSPFRTTNF